MIGAFGEVNSEVIDAGPRTRHGGPAGSRRFGGRLPSRLAPFAAAAAAVGFFAWNIARFFPNPAGHLGYDYGLFLPWLIAGFYWHVSNGWLSPPAFLPSFCGGIPFLFNPQSLYYSLPQWLVLWVQPVRSLLISWEAFGLAGGLGMYALLRRGFLVSVPSALLGATIFLLNGFYTARMIIGHAPFHGVMLLPAIGLAIFAPRPRPGLPERVVRSVLTGLLLAYVFYSGGINVILPMVLALLILALMIAYTGRWHRDIAVIAVAGGLLCVALCAYKLLPALAFAANVVRPVALRMNGNLPALVGGAVVSLFVPQVLSHLGPDRLIVDRAELEYGVGIVPLLALLAVAWVALRRRRLRHEAGRHRWVLLGLAVLLMIPILVNFDGLGLRLLLLHLPVVKSMSVMLRFWFAYIPMLCVVTALAFDQLIRDPARRGWWSAAAIVVTVMQCAATDMSYYAGQVYDPGLVAAAYSKIRLGGGVPAITRIADPWAETSPRTGSSRDDSLVDGVSAFPCYEPMFGYRLEVFKRGRLASGPLLESRDGRLNLKNPACYVFPGANGCAPGDEFAAGQEAEAEAFAAYRPYRYEWPVRQYVATGVSVAAWTGCLVALMGCGPLVVLSSLRRRRR
jgi:hypothetical protein